MIREGERRALKAYFSGEPLEQVCRRFGYSRVRIKAMAEDYKSGKIDIFGSMDKKKFDKQFKEVDLLKALLPQVILKYRSHPRKEVIGLIDADSGQVVVLPQYQSFQKDRCDRLLARCYTSEHRYPFCCGDVELYSVRRIPENGAPAPEWVDHDGLRVNAAYLDLFKK